MRECNCSSGLQWCREKYYSTVTGTFLWGLFFLICKIIDEIEFHFTPYGFVKFYKCHILTLQPTRGRITVGGEDVRTFDKSEWARVVSIVNQVSLWIFSLLIESLSLVFVLPCLIQALFVLRTYFWTYTLGLLTYFPQCSFLDVVIFPCPPQPIQIVRYKPATMFSLSAPG